MHLLESSQAGFECAMLQYVAICCNMLQYVAICCNMLQYVAICINMLQLQKAQVISNARLNYKPTGPLVTLHVESDFCFCHRNAFELDMLGLCPFPQDASELVADLGILDQTQWHY